MAARDPHYDILFEPVTIGPVTARNRFYQVPHCCGMGHRYPSSMAAMRGVKAEGGWAVVCTEETEIHHSAEITPFVEGRIWDAHDMPSLARMAEAVHVHGSLAGIELCHNGLHAPNHYSRDVPLAPSHAVIDQPDPVQARAMDKSDIANLRRWHRKAALRAKEAGFDIVYVYAGHDMSLFQHFLSRRHNHRSDEYGGTLQNRVRLIREVLEDTKEAVGDRCAVAFRLAVDELLGEAGLSAKGEGYDIVAMLAELPDLWDVNVSGWPNDSQTARFAEEGYQEPYIAFVKQLTTKPVVGVGRYTSPDAMVRVIRQGIMDMIGSARASIADPFLPKKIEDGRIDDIRECIGCNLCAATDNFSAPIRCTQNPTMGEEWRRGWHPETIPPLARAESVLVIGGGPAGLEAARALGQRGAEVTIAEGSQGWGGRSASEARLPGLATWARVRDWRLGQLAADDQRRDVPGQRHDGRRRARSRVTPCGAGHRKPLARRRGRTRAPHARSGPRCRAGAHPGSFPPQRGVETIAAPVVVFDDDGYYMGAVLAELMARAGHLTVYVTPHAEVSRWTHHTMEQPRIQARLIELGVAIHPHRMLAGRTADRLELACTFTGRLETIACSTLIPVTSRLPEETLWLALCARKPEWADAGIGSVTRIGDCLAPGTIAAAVYSGHRYAREFGEKIDLDVTPFRRESVA
jgi:dimethylamine/trimethylamine dehydrogenase